MMPELFPLLLSALMLGLLSSVHCLGMCGGLVSAMGLAIPKTQQARRLSLLLSYNLGRTLSYMLAGLLLGLGGWGLAQQGPLVTVLRVLAAGLLITMGLYLTGLWNGLNHLEGLGAKLWRSLQPLGQGLLPIHHHHQALGLGLVWGWLPCGLVYSTLLWAASQGNALHSMLLMLAFALGTWPALLITGLGAARLQHWLRQRRVRLGAGLLVILCGLWTLLGPHQHGLGGH